MLGRAAERLEIERRARAASARRGGVLLVAGEAGVGKTTLVEAALQRSESDRGRGGGSATAPGGERGGGLAVLRGASARGAASPLAPVLAAIRSHPAWPAAAFAAIDGRWISLLGTLLSELASPAAAADPSTQAEALRRLVCGLARARPVALVLDDLQWADHATLDFIASLAPVVERESLLVVGVYRTDEVPRSGAVRRLRLELRRAGSLDEISLEALGEADTLALAARTLGSMPSPRLGRSLVERSGGIPLFVEELAAALLAERRLRVGIEGFDIEDDWLPLPDSVRDAILIRADGLPANTRRALQVAALAPEPFDPTLVRDILDPVGAGPGDPLALAVDGGLLVESADGRLAFRHALVRDAFAGDPAGGDRRAIHEALARSLSARGAPPLAVGEAWLAAGRPAEAIPRFLEAAEASARVHAYRDAASMIERALAVWPADVAGRVEAVERLAWCLELSGALLEAATLWGGAAADRAAGGEVEAAGDDHRRRATALELRGRWERAMEARASAAACFAVTGRTGDAAAERLAIAAHLRSAASFAAARDGLAVALGEAAAAGRRDLEARILGLDGNILARMGQSEAGIDLIRRGLALAMADGLTGPSAELYQRLADALEHAGRYAVARDAYLEGVDYCRARSIEPTAQLCLACMTVVLWQTGAWAAAEKTCREVIASGASTQHARAVAHGVLGVLQALRGRPSRGRGDLHASLGLARTIDLAAMELISTWGLALCDRLDGDGAAAAERCAKLLGRWAQTEERHYAVPLIRWAATFGAERGDAAGVRECAAALGRIAAQTGQPEALAGLAVALGEAALLEGSAEVAADHFASALAHLATRDLPLDRADVGRRAGSAMLRAGRREEGVAALVVAHRTARRLGAAPLAAAIAADLRAAGEPIERRLGRREASRLDGGGLTRRELEILRLVAAGRTSTAIGEALFISTRTVDMHVGNVLAKLDCRTRAEAAHRADRLGLLG